MPHISKVLLLLLWLVATPILGCGNEAEVTNHGVEPGLVVAIQPDEDPERPGYFDFGVVEDGQIVSHTFVLENKDSRDVTIQKVDPGCGCTVARVMRIEKDGSRTPPMAERPLELLILEPGMRAEIELLVDTKAVKIKNIDKAIGNPWLAMMSVKLCISIFPSF